MGKALGHWGERNVLAFEYIGLIGVFLAYGGIYVFGWGVVLAASLYVLDHLFFALAFAQKTMPMPQLKARRISASSIPPVSCNHENTAGRGQALNL